MVSCLKTIVFLIKEAKGKRESRRMETASTKSKELFGLLHRIDSCQHWGLVMGCRRKHFGIIQVFCGGFRGGTETGEMWGRGALWRHRYGKTERERDKKEAWIMASNDIVVAISDRAEKNVGK